MTNFLPDWLLGLFLLVVVGLVTEGIHAYWRACHSPPMSPPMSPIVALVPAGDRPGRE